MLGRHILIKTLRTELRDMHTRTDFSHAAPGSSSIGATTN